MRPLEDIGKQLLNMKVVYDQKLGAPTLACRLYSTFSDTNIRLHLIGPVTVIYGKALYGKKLQYVAGTTLANNELHELLVRPLPSMLCPKSPDAGNFPGWMVRVVQPGGAPPTMKAEKQTMEGSNLCVTVLTPDPDVIKGLAVDGRKMFELTRMPFAEETAVVRTVGGSGQSANGGGRGQSAKARAAKRRCLAEPADRAMDEEVIKEDSESDALSEPSMQKLAKHLFS